MNIKLNPNKKTHIALVTILYAVFAYLVNISKMPILIFCEKTFGFHSMSKYAHIILTLVYFINIYFSIAFLRFLLNEKFVKFPHIKYMIFYFIVTYIVGTFGILPIPATIYYSEPRNIYLLISIIIPMAFFTTYLLTIIYPSLVNIVKFEKIKLSWKPSKLLYCVILPINILGYLILSGLIEHNSTIVQIMYLLFGIALLFALSYNAKKTDIKKEI